MAIKRAIRRGGDTQYDQGCILADHTVMESLRRTYAGRLLSVRLSRKTRVLKQRVHDGARGAPILLDQE